MKKTILTLVITCPILYLGQIKEMISGGDMVSVTDVPYQVSIQKYGVHNCGGSVLNARWILTAAHCFKDASMTSIYNVKAGISKLDTPTILTRNYDIKQIVIHPNYNSFAYDNDIALVEVLGGIEFNQDTKPINIVESNEALYNEGRSTKVAGWGLPYPEAPNSSNELRVVDVPIISNASAQVYMGGTLITENMIATGAVSNDRKGTCPGDSGGALVTKDEYGVTKQIGIVSWGKAKCIGGRNSPSIYTKVANYIDWIKQYISLSSNVEGKNTLCNAETATYTFDASGASFAWQVSDNLVKNSETGSSITITPKPNATGAAYIKAIIDGKEITKKIWIGKPQVEYELTELNEYLISYKLVSKVRDASIEEQGITSIICANPIFVGKGYISPDCVVGKANSSGRDWSVYRETIVSNACGSVKEKIDYVSRAADPCPYHIVSMDLNTFKIEIPCSSNPIRSVNTINKDVITIQIVNTMGQTVLTTTDTTFSINHLLSGTYYARVIKDGQVVHAQTLIKK